MDFPEADRLSSADQYRPGRQPEGGPSVPSSGFARVFGNDNPTIYHTECGHELPKLHLFPTCLESTPVPVGRGEQWVSIPAVFGQYQLLGPLHPDQLVFQADRASPTLRYHPWQPIDQEQQQTEHWSTTVAHRPEAEPIGHGTRTGFVHARTCRYPCLSLCNVSRFSSTLVASSGRSGILSPEVPSTYQNPISTWKEVPQRCRTSLYLSKHQELEC